MKKPLLFASIIFFVSASLHAAEFFSELSAGPKVLVLYDGPDQAENPGRLDAMYLANLLGHFTTRRTVMPLENYKPGDWKAYDAVFGMVFKQRYTIPTPVLADAAQMTKPFCWMGNQTAQLNQFQTLSRHGIRYVRFSNKIKLNQVTYKGRTVVKGDSETNVMAIENPALAQEIATVQGPGGEKFPYILRSGNFWLVADSPFSYSAENDRYLVFADVLHDVLGIDHPESHRALVRIEDINARSDPGQLKATLDVLKRYDVPFSFGFVPIYINPHDRLEFRMTEKPEVLRAVKRYVAAGGVPILHGYTHQYRGVTTDDYEFWDDLGDRPVRGDSAAFATHRIEEGIKEALHAGFYPALWETPHYAASEQDYLVFKKYFSVAFERRQVANHLGTDQFFPYPVIDMLGQPIIPETLAYIPRDDLRVEPLLENADANLVVRDGWASFFYHPFLKPELLDKMLKGIQDRGYRFADVRMFPNRAQMTGRVISHVEGPVRIDGQGRYLEEKIIGPTGRVRSQHTLTVDPKAPIDRTIRLMNHETYVAIRQDIPPPTWFQKLIRMAKGDLSFVQRKWDTVFSARTLQEPVKCMILWNSKARGDESRNQESFQSILSSMGYDLERIDYTGLEQEDFGPFTLLVVPHAAAKAFDEEDVEKVMGALKRGLTLVTDGESPLSAALGIKLGEAFPVKNLHDHLFTEQDTRWASTPTVRWIAEPSPEELEVYYSERDLGRPLVVGGSRGEGRFLYYAPLFDPESGQGYARFPNLPQLLINEWHLSPLLKRYGADVYFDPGYRPGISIEVLAKMWKRFGIRAVHVAAWNFYDKWSYDYARLIKVAHQNGILVYAWVEWPHVSQRFWDSHPEWREKTGTERDAHVDWRLHMNLQDPDCYRAVMNDITGLLKAYDWDGVNLGEFTFESPAGPDRPDLMTPFNAIARREFEKGQGFDPLELFKTNSAHFWKKDSAGLQGFYAYRKNVNQRLFRSVLTELKALNLKDNRGWEFIVTMLDGLQHPFLEDYLGFDFKRSLAFMNQQNITLQAEDPASEWRKAPDRYVTLGQKYADLGLKKPFMIDINVLPVHPADQPSFATAQPTGSEMLQLWKAASQFTPRICLYSESTVFEQDWQVLPYGMASRAQVRKDGSDWIVQTPHTVILDLGREARKVQLNGEPWFAGQDGEIWLPAGEHRVSFVRRTGSVFDTSKLDTHLISLSGELLNCQKISRGLEVTYQSAQRCVLVFDKTPLRVELDGVSTHMPALKGDDGFTIIAPEGTHHIRVVTESALLYVVQYTGMVSASLIVLFGLASSGLLALLFSVIWLRRRLHKWMKKGRRK